MPENARTKQLADAGHGLDAHRMGNIDVTTQDRKGRESTEHQFQLDGSTYFPPGEEHRDAGGFGATRVLVDERGDWIVVKKVDTTPTPTSPPTNTTADEAAFSRLAHLAAGGGESRVVPARAIGASTKGGANDLIIMDLMVGGNLRKAATALFAAMIGNLVTHEEACVAITYLCREFALGVAQIASAGVVHNDLKLDNVLLDDAMNIRIADFGCAAFPGGKALQGHKSVRDPSLAQNGCSFATDVFSLGTSFDQLAYDKFIIHPIHSLAQRMITLEASKRPTAQEVASDAALNVDAPRARAVLLKVANHNEAREVRQKLAAQRKQDVKKEQRRAEKRAKAEAKSEKKSDAELAEYTPDHTELLAYTPDATQAPPAVARTTTFADVMPWSSEAEAEAEVEAEAAEVEDAVLAYGGASFDPETGARISDDEGDGYQGAELASVAAPIVEVVASSRDGYGAAHAVPLAQLGYGVAIPAESALDGYGVAHAVPLAKLGYGVAIPTESARDGYGVARKLSAAELGYGVALPSRHEEDEAHYNTDATAPAPGTVIGDASSLWRMLGAT